MRTPSLRPPSWYFSKLEIPQNLLLTCVLSFKPTFPRLRSPSSLQKASVAGTHTGHQMATLHWPRSVPLSFPASWGGARKILKLFQEGSCGLWLLWP